MSLFSRFFPKKEQKAINPNLVNTKFISNVLTPLPLEFKLSDSYTSLSAVYTVVSYLMQKFASVPIRLYMIEDEAALKQYKSQRRYQFQRPSNYLKVAKLKRKALSQEDEKSDLAKLLQHPNGYTSSDLFFQTLYGFKLLKGEGIVWFNRGEGYEGTDAPPLEMHIMPPYMMYLEPDKEDIWGIRQWVLMLPQQRVLEAKDVMLWRYPRFDFDTTTHIHLRGQSPLTAAETDLEGIASLNAAWTNTYLNRGANGIIATQDTQMTTEQMSIMLRTINERINGASNAGTISGINAVAPQFFDLSMGARDMQLIEAKKFSVTQVAQLYQVPAGIFDLSESANNNIVQYREQVYTDKLMSEWDGLLSQLNSELLPAFGLEGRAYIDADFSEVPDLQASFQKMVDGIKDAWEVTPNEKRELRGYDRSEDELMDTHWVPSGYKPIEDASINVDYELGATTNLDPQAGTAL